MSKLIQFKLTQLILVNLLHRLCLIGLLLFFESFYYWFWHFLAILKGFWPRILLFLLFFYHESFCDILNLVGVNGFNLAGKLLHFLLFFPFFLPLFATNVSPQSSQLDPLFLWFFSNWLSSAIHWRSVSSFFWIFDFDLFSLVL